MGFLDQNTTYLGDITFPVVEGYCGSIGAAIANVDGIMNDYELFEAAVKYDFNETLALKEEGVDIFPLQEASVSDIVDRIVEFLKKLGSKVQALFTNIMAKLESYLNKDTKKFVTNYEGKLTGKTFTGMKAKYAAPSGEGYIFNHDYHMNISVTTADAGEFNRDEFISETLGAIVGGGKASSKEFKEKVHKALYGEESTKEDWSLDDIKKIANRLKSADAPLKALKARNDALQASIKKVIGEISKAKKGMKAGKGDNTDVSGVNTSFSVKSDGEGASSSSKGSASHKKATSDTVSKLQANLARAQKEATAHQSAIMTFCSTIFNEAKWGISQDRRVFAQAVAFNNLKDQKKDTSVAEAVAELAQYECESDFEDMEVYA